MFKKIFLFVLVVCVGATGVVYYLYNKPAEKVESMKGISVSALDLAKEYNSNEKAADAKYLDQAIEVTGMVTEIEQNQDGGSMVILQTDDPTAGIQCALRDAKTSVTKGATVTIKGKCSGNGITGVTLTECIITN